MEPEHARPVADRAAGAADAPVPGHAGDGAQRDRPPGRRVRGDARADRRQTARHRPPGGRTSGPRSAPTERCWPPASSSGSTTPDEQGRTVRLVADLPVNFALNQPLSTFALAALELLDVASESYALDVVSVFEATLEDPRQVLSAQQHKARGEAVAAMKADGLDYDERMELLDEVTYPKPLDELLGTAFAIYRQQPPMARRGPALAEVGRARHVGTGDDLHRVRLLLRAHPQRGTRAALPVRCVPRAALERARLGPDRGADRHGRVARRARAAGRLQPARRVGAADLRRRGGRPPRGPAVRTGVADRQRPGVHRPRPQRAVPPRRAGGAAPRRRAGRAGRRGRLGFRALGRGARRLLRRVRPDRHRRRRAQCRPAAHRRPRRCVAGSAGVRRSGR